MCCQVCLASGSIVVGQRLVDSHGARGVLELLAECRSMSCGNRPDAARILIAWVALFRRPVRILRPRGRFVTSGGAGARSARPARLALTLELRHQLDQLVALAACAAAGAAEQGVSQVGQAELPHLPGEPDLRVGFEPQAEKSLGCLPCSVCVAGRDRGSDRQRLRRSRLALSMGWTASSRLIASAGDPCCK